MYGISGIYHICIYTPTCIYVHVEKEITIACICRHAEKLRQTALQYAQ